MKRLSVVLLSVFSIVVAAQVESAEAYQYGGYSAPRPRPRPRVPVGPRDSPIQSSARPHGMKIKGNVKLAGIGDRAKKFQKEHLSTIFQHASKLVQSSVAFGDSGKLKLDPTRLFLTSKQPYPVRVYFISEGAGFHNCIGVSINLAGSKKLAEKLLVFPDASMPVPGTGIGLTGMGPRSPSQPLHPGDFVDLGRLPAGTQLDFFIVRDGARRGRDIFTNHLELNPDKFQHFFAMVIPDTPFLLIGYEDLFGGGDRDFEDGLFVVDIGFENAKNLGRISKLPK